MTSNRLWTAIMASIVIFFLTIQTGEAIHCWVCDSSEDHRCGSTFDNHTIAYVDCEQNFRAAGKNATFCRKYIQLVQGEFKITRACGWVNATGENAGDTCYQRSGSSEIYTTHCACYTPGCNSATSVLPTTIIVAPFLAVLLNYFPSLVTHL